MRTTDPTRQAAAPRLGGARPGATAAAGSVKDTSKTAKRSFSVRPAMEAALLAALAFGAAQIGWATLNPNAASATGSDEASARADAARAMLNAGNDEAAQAPVQSPFAVNAAAASLEGNAAAFEAAIAGFSVAGVRVSTDAARSSAVFATPDGAQRAFRIGEELAAGVRLGDVSGDHVIVTYPGGSRRLELARVASVSFARAFMGEADALAVLTPASAVAPLSSLSGAQQPLTPADMTPFTALDAAPVAGPATGAADLVVGGAVAAP